VIAGWEFRYCRTLFYQIAAPHGEDYYRYDPEQTPQGNQVPTVDKLLFRESGSPPTYNPNPSDLNNGFLLDRVILASSGNNK